MTYPSRVSEENGSVVRVEAGVGGSVRGGDGAQAQPPSLRVHRTPPQLSTCNKRITSATANRRVKSVPSGRIDTDLYQWNLTHSNNAKT